MPTHTPINELEQLGVTVAYAPRMERDALWLPRELLMILNAERPRHVLAVAVEDLWQAVYDHLTRPRSRTVAAGV
jgi:hypothetical protein